jgi:hypothetical protein
MRTQGEITMTTRALLYPLVLVLLVLAPLGLEAQSASQGIMFGNWKLVVAKSDFGKGPKLMGMTTKVSSDTAALVQFSVDQTTESGMAVSYSFKGAADGKAYPLTGSSSVYSYSEDPGTVHETQRDTDGTLTKGDFTLSASGKVGTWLYIITNPDGTVVKQKLVFARIVN